MRVESLMPTEDEAGEMPDLDAARGLLPAIAVGAAFWVILFAIVF